MSYNRRLVNKINLTSKIGAADRASPDYNASADVMANADYLRQSSALINDALQKGFDILQLADGDIVMTGIKTVVYQYTWDNEKGKLVRAKAKSSKGSSENVHEDVLMEDDI